MSQEKDSEWLSLGIEIPSLLHSAVSVYFAVSCCFLVVENFMCGETNCRNNVTSVYTDTIPLFTDCI